MGRHSLAAVPAPGPQREPHSVIMTVTPSLAREWLGHNTNNRNLRESAVARYARDMASGAWGVNADAITFGTDGTLYNGQHRLHGIVRADVPVKCLVVFDAPPEAWDVIDIGIARRFGDALKRAGEANPSCLAAVARRAVMWEMGARTNIGTVKPTHAEMAAFIDEHPEIRTSAEFAEKTRRTAGIPASVIGLSHWLFTRKDYEAGVWFLSRVADGVGLERGHPALAFRARLAKERERGGHLPETRALALLIRAWNAYRKGEMRSKLQLKNDDIPDPL